MGVLAFVGPTGSGKSYVAQALGRVLMVDESRMVYVDCQRLGQASDPVSNLHDQLVAGRCNSQMAMAFNQSPFAQPPLLFPAAPPPIPVAAFSPGPFSIVVFDEADKAPAPFRENLCRAIDQGWMQSNGDPLADLMLSGRLLPGMLVSVNYQPPRSFLTFQIMIPRLVPPDMPLMKSIALEESAID
jgi:energy-coupling factor transporter ATP-binding protein EcfA2